MSNVGLVILGLGGLVAVVLFRQQSQAQLAVQAQTGNPLANTVHKVADTSSSYLHKIPWVGEHVLDPMLNAPIQNVVHGDWKATIWSAATGGISDFF